jgi:hypothetical protein
MREDSADIQARRGSLGRVAATVLGTSDYQDERIRESKNRIAATAFRLTLMLISIGLAYRIFYLNQHPREWWDLGIAFFVGGGYFNLRSVAEGNVQNSGGTSLPRLWRRLAFLVPIWLILLVYHHQGQESTNDLISSGIVGLLVAIPIFALIVFRLDRLWKNRNESPDENG